MKYNQFGEVIAVNGIVTGQHLGAPMQDAQCRKPEDNEPYAIQKSTNCKLKSSYKTLENQPEKHVLADVGKTVTVKTDTLYWDGNTEGLVVGEMIDNGGEHFKLFRISEATPPFDKLVSNGISFTTVFDDIYEDENDGDIEYNDGDIEYVVDNFASVVGSVFIAYEDNIEATWSDNDSVFNIPKKGIYVFEYSSNLGDNVTSITIPGFNGFERTEIKKIPAEYLPDGVPYEEENIVDIAGMEYVVNLNGDHNGLDGDENTHNLNLPLALGQKWKCTPIQNGTIERVDYSSELEVKQSDDGELYLGDADPQNINEFGYRINVDTCEGNFGAMSRGGIYHVKIVGVSGTYEGEPIVHKIPEKYLPSNVMEFSFTDENAANITFRGKTVTVNIEYDDNNSLYKVPREFFNMLTIENLLNLHFVFREGEDVCFSAVIFGIFEGEIVRIFSHGDGVDVDCHSFQLADN